MNKQFSSSMDKENQSEESNAYNEEQLKKNLHANLEKAGFLNALKSNMRSQFYQRLGLANEKMGLNLKDKSNRLSYKVAISMVADLMKKCDMGYALSVFLPECGIQQEILTKSELLEVLKLDKDEHYVAANKPEMTPLLLDLVDIIKLHGSIRPNKMSCHVQTEEAGEAFLTLDQKLRKIDHSYLEKSESERLMPFKTLEERMLKYKRECDNQYKVDLESEIRRLKEFEMSKLRIEEAQKYREKLQQYRDDMENLLQDKLKELKIRENEAWDRIKNRERDLDKQSFELRQKQLRDEDVLRARENEIKKTIEVDQHLLRNEKDLLCKTQREYELKLKDLENMRVKLEKEHLEEIERFKSDFLRSYKDQDFDIHRRRLQLEEDEQRLKYDKDRLALVENKNVNLEREMKEAVEDLKKFKQENHFYHKENLEQKDQLKTLNANLSSQYELKASQDREMNVLVQESMFVKQQLKELQEQSSTFKGDQNTLIESLKTQLENLREQSIQAKDINERERRKLKEKYEDQKRRESEKFQFEYEKLQSELHILAKRLGQEEHFSKELAVYNNKLQNNLGSIRGSAIGKGDFYNSKVTHNHFYHDEEDGADDQSDEILKRKKAWAELEREQEEVKRNIKSMMKTQPESRVMDDPILAERVRGVRYEPQKFDYEEKLYEGKKQTQLKEEMKKAEKQSKPSPKKQDTQKRQWTADSATTNYNKQPSLESKKDVTPKKEEEKYTSYQPTTKSEPKQTEVKPSTQSALPSSYGQSNYASPPAQSQPKQETKSALVNQPNAAVQAQNNNSASKKSTFKGPSFNPFMKRDNNSNTTTPTTTANHQPVNTFTSTVNQPQPSLYQPTFAQQANNTGKLADGKNSALRKSTEKSQVDVVSDNIDDIYDEDFDVDETQTKKSGGGFFITGGNKNANEESSGGFEEQDNDDYF